jgi:FdhD protein
MVDTDSPAVATASVRRVLAAGGHRTGEQRQIACEMPVSITVNGAGHAVMMASPIDLEDFAYGFALTDGLIDMASDILSVEIQDIDPGIVLKMEITEQRFAGLANRSRATVGNAGCGICGIVNLEQALRPLPVLAQSPVIASDIIFSALRKMPEQQTLNAATGAVHAAAFFSSNGDLVALREDIGRHNAFDKLIGALLRGKSSVDSGFAVLTSRCSYELVEKAALAGISHLVTISAPTTLAIERAKHANLTLVCLARADSLLVLNDPLSQYS